MKYLFFIYLLLLSSYAFANGDNSLDKDIKFVQDFLKCIYAKDIFSLNNEKQFLGESGDVSGIALSRQSIKSMLPHEVLEKSKNFSFIGMLLQKEKEKIFYPETYHGPTYWGILSPEGVRQLDKKSMFSISFSYTYVVMLRAERKDVMSLSTPLRLCVFAIDKSPKGTRRINLHYSICQGQRILDILGFIDSDKFPDITLSQEKLSEFVNYIIKTFYSQQI